MKTEWNPWKMTAIGMALVSVTALVTGLVVANRSGRDEPTAAAPAAVARPAATHLTGTGPRVAPVAQPQPTGVPSQAVIDACNQYAAAPSSQPSKTMEIVKDGAIGAVVGAAVGAAGGAIAGGGQGAGKGAVIGGLVGAGGGALYGINENGKNDARYRDAYASCLRSRGYTG